jgi:hypothetical protein
LVLTVVGGTTFPAKSLVKSAFDEYGFDSLNYSQKCHLMRMRHAASNLFVDVWCDTMASHTVASLSEARVTAAAGLVEGNELLRVLHRVLRCAAGAELRVCERYRADAKLCLGSYVLLLLIHHWLAEAQHNNQSGGTHQQYRHDGGVETARALLALLDYLAGLLEPESVIELHEPPPISHVPSPPNPPPIRFDLRRMKKGGILTQKAAEAAGTLTRYTRSTVVLTTLARLLAEALRRGVSLEALIRPMSAERTELIEGVCEALQTVHGWTPPHLSNNSPISQIKNALAEAEAYVPRLATSSKTAATSMVPTAHALAGLGGTSRSTTSAGSGRDEPEEGDVYEDNASDISDVSYFTNRWLPSGIEGLTVGDESAASNLGSLGLNRNAPVFVPRALQGISE